MRVKPDKMYCPDPHMKSNMTLYEMAYSMSESDPQDPQEAIPYLCNWLLKDFADSYQYSDGEEDIKLDEGVVYNIAYFLFYNFINRETGSKVPEVFRTKLLKEIVNMNLDHDFYNILMDIKNTTATLTKNIVTNDDLVHDGTNIRTDNLASSSSRTDGIDSTDTTTHNTTKGIEIDSITTTEGKVITDTDTTSSNTKTLGTTSTTTNNLTDTKTFNTSDQTTNNLQTTNSNREVLTDYPQSTVNTQTVGSWTYASGARDSNGTTQNTGTSTLAKTGTETDAKTGTQAVADTGTVQDAGSGTVDDTTTTDGKTIVDSNETETNTGTDTVVKDYDESESISTTNTGTVNNKSDFTNNRDIETNESWTGLSGFELNAAQLDIYSRHDNFYKTLMRRFENCFISVYVDEDRDGWMDPSINLFSAWNPL